MNRPAESLKGPRVSILSTDAQRRSHLHDGPLAPPAAQPPSSKGKNAQSRVNGDSYSACLPCFFSSMFALMADDDRTTIATCVEIPSVLHQERVLKC